MSGPARAARAAPAVDALAERDGALRLRPAVPPIMAHRLMTLVHELFQDTLSYYEKKLSQLVADEQGDGDEAKEKRNLVSHIQQEHLADKVDNILFCL